MTHVMIEIPDEQLLSLVLEAQRGEVAVDSLIEAVFQWGMNVYNGDISISQRIDTGDNDFIVYHAEDDTWSKFNIIEECHFKVKKSFYEFF